MSEVKPEVTPEAAKPEAAKAEAVKAEAVKAKAVKPDPEVAPETARFTHKVTQLTVLHGRSYLAGETIVFTGAEAEVARKHYATPGQDGRSAQLRAAQERQSQLISAVKA